MPTYEITSPDGAKYRVDAPEGATEQDALRYVQGQHSASPQQPAPAANVTAPQQPQSDADRLQSAHEAALSGAESFGLGLAKPVVGASQLVNHLLPDVPGVPYLRRKSDELAKSVNDESEALNKNGFDWWGLAGNVASPINYLMPGGLLGRGSALARAGSAAVQGAGVAAMQPVIGSGSYTGQKAVQAGTGAVIGGVISPMADAVGALFKWITAAKRPEAANDKALRAILDRIEKDEKGGGPSAQDMLDLLSTAPDNPMILPDVGGHNLSSLLGRIARSPGEAKQIISDFLSNRDLDAGLRLSEDVNQGIGQGSAHDTAHALAAARSKAAAPKYEAAFSRIVTTPEEAERVQRFIHDPIGQDALQRGMRVIQLEKLAAGEPFKPTDYGVTRGEDGRYVLGPGVPNLRLMDAVKRGYDEIVEDFRDKTTGRLNLNQYGRAVNLVRATYVGELRDMYQRYAAALDAWGGPSRSIDALQAGREFLNREPEEIRRRLGALSPNDKEFYKLGAAAALRKMIARTGPQGDEARRIVGNAYTREQLRPLFDNDADYDKFINSVKAESMMFKTGARALSQTAERQAEDMSPSDTGMAAAHGLRGGMEVLHGNPWAGYHLARAWEHLRPKGDPITNAAIARHLVSPPNELLDALHGLPPSTPSAAMRATPFVVPGAAAVTGNATP